MVKAIDQSPEPLMELVRRLYPICRSITGDGVRKTLAIVSEQLPLEIHEVPTGTAAFDWSVPDEWNIRDAYVMDEAGERLVDFMAHNLHVLNYSVPVDSSVSLDELQEHLYSMPEHPNWIPYRTSYYAKKWGFCLTQNQRDALNAQQYRVRIDTDLAPGHLTYGEYFVPGRSRREVVLYTHVCHPSLCNDNLSGIAVLTQLGKELATRKRRYSYRLIFAPGTIGSIVWLSQNKHNLGKIAHGLVVGLLGDQAPFTYKQSRSADSEIDRIASYVLGRHQPDYAELAFSPYGYDERQFGSPGISLPVGRLTRSVNGGYPQYHSSADDLSIVSENRLQESLQTVIEILDTLDDNRHYVNLSPNCEPQLGKRGLYRDTGGAAIADRESAMLWLLNQSDGENSMLDIARKSELNFESLIMVAADLEKAKLLRASEDD